MKLNYIVFNHADARVKIVAANTDLKQILAIYASDSSAEIGEDSVVNFYTSDNELFSELRNNIGSIYDISFDNIVTGKTITKATKLQR